MPRVPWLEHQSCANVLSMGAAEWHESTGGRGRFDATTMAKIKDSIRWTLDLGFSISGIKFQVWGPVGRGRVFGFLLS